MLFLFSASITTILSDNSAIGGDGTLAKRALSRFGRSVLLVRVDVRVAHACSPSLERRFGQPDWLVHGQLQALAQPRDEEAVLLLE